MMQKEQVWGVYSRNELVFIKTLFAKCFFINQHDDLMKSILDEKYLKSLN